MHGFLNSPALSRVVALQMAEEQRQPRRRKRAGKVRTAFRARWQSRRTTPAPAPSPQGHRVAPTGRLVEDA
jgi:hypothetical protein